MAFCMDAAFEEARCGSRTFYSLPLLDSDRPGITTAWQAMARHTPPPGIDAATMT